MILLLAGRSSGVLSSLVCPHPCAVHARASSTGGLSYALEYFSVGVPASSAILRPMIFESIFDTVLFSLR